MKKVFVTGVTGYIGKHVVEALIGQGVEVSTNLYKNREVDPRIRVYDVDIFAEDDLLYEKIGRPDVCLHLAWTDGFVHNSEAHLKNLYSHYRFVKQLINGGLKHLAILGTMHEVGYYEGAIDEHTETNPTSFYGIAKNSLRQSIDVLTKDKEVVVQWLRAYYIMGDDTNNKSIFAKLIQAEQEGKTMFPFTTGKNHYDFIDVEVLSAQIANVVLQNEINGIINCCTGEPRSLKDVVEQFIKDNNFNIELKYGAFPDRPYDSPAVWGCSKKINEIMRKTSHSITN